MKPNETQIAIFRHNLLEWFSQNVRPLPWKGEKNPYLIWLSEIILQQTRVEQGLPYFNNFRKKYPSVTDLANAPEDEVMKLWQGLGYYSRARNLHSTAKYIVTELNASFPTTYAALLQLKGVGTYTAAAIASFAYDLPHAVVDGNVFRVLSRFLGISTAIDSSEGKHLFTEIANMLLLPERAADFNQAIMDFGATCCKPAAPLCADCVMKTHCFAYQHRAVQDFPKKEKKLIRKTRFFNYFFIKNTLNEIFINKRQTSDIWRDLYEFPMIETNVLISDFKDILKIFESKTLLTEGGTEEEEAIENDRVLTIKKLLNTENYNILPISVSLRQQLTHQQIIGTFWEIDVMTDFNAQTHDFLCVAEKNLNNFAFPKIISTFLEKKNKTKNLLLF